MGSFAPPPINHKTLKELSMRQIACVLSFMVAQQLAAQSAGPYSVTHSSPLGGVNLRGSPSQTAMFINGRRGWS
jgi:hypothetical protein